MSCQQKQNKAKPKSVKPKLLKRLKIELILIQFAF